MAAASSSSHAAESSTQRPLVLHHASMRLLSLLLVLVTATSVRSSLPTCSQASFDSAAAPAPGTLGMQSFTSVPPMRGFYQWESNQGYCGEVSLIQSALARGQWISQFNIRSLASPAASDQQTQTEAPNNQPSVLQSQMLLDDSFEYSKPAGNNFGQAAAAFGLVAKAYPSAAQAPGLQGYQHFMLWLKAELRSGHHVTIGVSDIQVDGTLSTPPYGHIVNVVRIAVAAGANYTAYNGSDVLYVDDHGVATCSNAAYPCTEADNTAVPPGAGGGAGCTPFVFGYTMDQWRRAPVDGRQSYGISVPSQRDKNFGYSISGVADTYGVTLPVSLAMVTALPSHPVAGQQYEAPYIGTSSYGDSSTNLPPAPMRLNLTVTVSSLKPGKAYVLYRYQWQARPLRAPLGIPTANFNAKAAQALSATRFTATGTTFVAGVATLSSYTEVFRCVPADAP